MTIHPEKVERSRWIQIQKILKEPWAPYIFPFATFIVLTALETCFTDIVFLLYTAKTLIVGLLLWSWRHIYAPDFSIKLRPAGYLIAVLAGLSILLAWISLETILPQLGNAEAFNPYSFDYIPAAVPLVIAFRLIGAALVVPFMEELFWRSFLLRYLINPDFKKVPLGTFTWFSFTIVVVLFGLEHHRWIQGIFAGIIYAGLIIHQKSLRGAVIAHVTTNLGLGTYVLATQNWIFW